MRLRIFSLIILLSLFLMPSSAQIPGNKLFAYSNGDIWTWFEDGTAQQITEWGYNGGPILAPTERYIAYLSISTEGVEEINAGQAYPFMGTPPTNIWIMDTATQLAERIALQENYPTLRGVPAWSPDGTKLAWLEFTQLSQAGMARLLVYDMETRTTTVLNDRINMGFQDAGYHVGAVQWGAHGISRLLFTFVENGELHFYLELYHPETGLLSPFLLSVQAGMGDSSNENSIPIDYVWVTHQGQEMIAVLTRGGSWYLLEPLTGNRYELNRAPGLVNNTGAASLIPVWTPANSWEIHWELHEGTINIALPFVSYGISTAALALAPDGTAAAWNDNGDLFYQEITGTSALTILDSPENGAFVQPASVVWSAMHWVTKGDAGAQIPSPVSSAGDACGLPSRLVIGDIVTVTEGEPNNVREEARLNSPVVAQFAPNDMAEVRDGPVCIDGFRWWYVANDNFEGWTAEGNATDYWLEPVRG